MVTEAFAPDFRRLVHEDAAFSKVATGLAFTEGPVWNHREGYLAWVDIIGDAIWKWVPGEGKSIVKRPSAHANGMTFDGEGRLVIAGWSGRTVWRIERDGTPTTLASHFNGLKLNTPTISLSSPTATSTSPIRPMVATWWGTRARTFKNTWTTRECTG